MCHNGGAPDAPLWQHARACCTILSFFALPFSLKLCPPVPPPINSTCEYSSARLLTRSELSKCTTCVINRPSYSGYLNEERARRVHRGRPVAIDRENKNTTQYTQNRRLRRRQQLPAVNCQLAGCWQDPVSARACPSNKP